MPAQAPTLPPSHISVKVEFRGRVQALVFDPTRERRVFIGRAPECEIALANEAMSRRHAMFLREGAGWFIVDLGSTHGTFLGDQRVRQPTRVRVGDQVRFGEATLTITDIGEPAEHERNLNRLVVDMEDGKAWFRGELLPLSASEFVWLAFLAQHRARGDGWVDSGQDGHAALREFVRPLMGLAWARQLRSQPLEALAQGHGVDDEDLKNLRGKMVRKLKTWGASRPGAMADLLTAERQGKSRSRLSLEPDRVSVEWPEQLPG